MPLKRLKRSLALAFALVPLSLATAKDDYKLGPDSIRQPNVPTGTLTKQPPWTSDVFPGTVRDWWIYVAAQYDDKKPACVMIFQDGIWYQDEKGSFRAPVVFDFEYGDGGHNGKHGGAILPDSLRWLWRE